MPQIPTSPPTPPAPPVSTKPAASSKPNAIRVLICDDSAFMRKALSQIVESDPRCTVVDTARNGKEAVEKAKALKPDVITLDIEMPLMSGHEALRAIRREMMTEPGGPPAVLMCSSLTSQGSHDALQALREGASDVIAKDHSTFSSKMEEMRSDLLRKVTEIGGARSARARRSSGASTNTGPSSPRRTGSTVGFSLAEQHAHANMELAATMDLKAISFSGKRCDLIVIGSSTGGPPILETIIQALPANMPCPIVIAQHMPASFTKAMAERLDGMSSLTVVHGEHGMPLVAGTVYIIPGAKHGRIRAIGGGPLRLEVNDEPTTAPFRPSVNELLSSAAACVGKNAVGVVLTGIGDDGRKGCEELKKVGAVFIAQDPASSVVYGMPRAAAEAGGISMTPEQIGQTLTTLVPGAATLRKSA